MTPMTRTALTRRQVLQASALSAIALPLAACGGSGGSGSSGEVTSLKILDYYADEPDHTVFQEALEAAAEKVGVTIERESVAGTSLIQKILQMSSSKTLPDLLMIDNPDLQQIAATGALAPLTSFGITTDGFIDGFVGAGTYEDEFYGMGPCANTLGLYYNVDLLEAAGVAVPTTWDELKAAAKTLTTGDAYGIAFCAKASYEGSWQFLPFFWSAGADETDIATPEAANALQLLVDLVNEGSASQSVLNWGQGEVGEQFTAGKAAMCINGPWMTSTFNDSGVNWAVAQIPVPTAGATSVSPLGGELWTIPETGDEARQKKAAELLGVLLGDESVLDLNVTRFTMPARPSVNEDYLAAQPDQESLVTAVGNGRARTTKLGEAWPKTAEALYNAMQSALTGKAEPLAALETAKADFVS